MGSGLRFYQSCGRALRIYSHSNSSALLSATHALTLPTRKEKRRAQVIRDADDDIAAVTNMHNVLVNHTLKTLADTGILPQIIVTDHADNLKLGVPNFTFDDLVGERRWRKRGFIS